MVRFFWPTLYLAYFICGDIHRDYRERVHYRETTACIVGRPNK